jgi:hypothetical protein
MVGPKGEREEEEDGEHNHVGERASGWSLPQTLQLLGDEQRSNPL